MTIRTLDRHMEKLQDGPDALPRGSAHTQAPYTGQHRNISVGIPTDHEMFRMRTRPELYPDWLVEQAMAHRAKLVDLVGKHTPVYDWDCHACQHAVVTPMLNTAGGITPGNTRCPKCGC